MNRNLIAIPILSMALLSGGCSTYYSNFSRFSGENSAGDLRDFVIHWYSEDSQDRKVRLSTQCSERVITFTPASETNACSEEGSTHLWCGEPGSDLDMRGKALTSAHQVCGSLKNLSSSAGNGLAREFALHVSCFPAKTERPDGDETINLDILKASTAPYIVRVKRVEAGSGADRLPKMSDKICD